MGGGNSMENVRRITDSLGVSAKRNFVHLCIFRDTSILARTREILLFVCLLTSHLITERLDYLHVILQCLGFLIYVARVQGNWTNSNKAGLSGLFHKVNSLLRSYIILWCWCNIQWIIEAAWSDVYCHWWCSQAAEPSQPQANHVEVCIDSGDMIRIAIQMQRYDIMQYIVIL